MRLILVRHAESAANAAGLISGTGDPELSERGLFQAEAVGAILGKSLDLSNVAIFASPSRRAASTAGAISAALDGVYVNITFELAEMDYGEWEGRSIAEIGSPAEIIRMFEDPAFAPPGGESVTELYGRSVSWARLIASEHDEGTVIAVTHLGPVKCFALWGLSAGVELFPRIRVSNASLTRVDIRGDLRTLISLNECQHLIRVNRS